MKLWQCKLAALGLLALWLLGACGPSPQQAATSELPPVRLGSTGFTVNGKMFRFIGANSIYLGFYPRYGFSVGEAIRTAKQNGITVLRIYLWLGDAPWGGRTPEEYDMVLDACAREGMYVIAVLTDCTPGDWGRTRQEYYSKVPHCDLASPEGLASFKEHISRILTRRNTANGRVYRDDTTILAWDVANEPPLYDFDHSDAHKWLCEVVPYIKSLDPKHLVTIGIMASSAAYDSAGAAYEALNVPGLDFFSFHYYPSDRQAPAELCRSDAYLDGLRFRTAQFLQMGKPVVLEEFGYGSQRELEARMGGEPSESELACWLTVYKKQMDTAFSAGASGVLFWGWGVPETKTVPLWWKNEDHDATEEEFCSLIRGYQVPAPR